MPGLDGKVLIGNVVLYPALIRKFLKKSHYWLTYDPKAETATLSANHGGGGETLFVIRNAPYESVVRLAEELGLHGDGSAPVMWDKWNPVLHLNYDGSTAAETVRMELLRFGVPFTQSLGCREFGLVAHDGLHSPPMWTLEMILKIVRETAMRYEDQLKTLP